MKKLVFFLILSFLLPAPALSADYFSEESVIIRHYRKALDSDPDNDSIRLQLTIAYLKENFFDNALEHLLVLRRNMPSDPDISYYLGIAYAGAGDLDGAFSAYSRVEELATGRVADMYELDKVFYNLGIAYQRNGELDAALRAYGRSVRVDNRSGLPYCRMGEVLFELRDYDEALDKFGTCSQKSEGDDRVRRHVLSTRLARGLNLVGDGRYEEALVDFRKAAEIEPDNENAVYFTGYVLYLLNDFMRAQKALERLRDPESPDIIENLPPLLQNIGIQLQKRGDWAAAETAIRQAVKMKMRSPDLHYLLGVNHENRGDYQGAAEELKEAVRQEPDHQKAIIALAVVTEKLLEEQIRLGEEGLREKDYEGALRSFELVLKTDPLNKRAAKGLRDAEAYLKATKYEVLRKRKDEIAVKLPEAAKYLNEEKFLDALLIYRYVLALDPLNSTAMQGLEATNASLKERKQRHAAMGDEYAKEQDFQQALREYRKAFSYDPADQDVQARISSLEREIRDRVLAIVERGAEHEKNRNYQDALKAYNEALKHVPDNSAALEGRARVSLAVKKAEAPKARAAKADRNEIDKLYFEGIELYTEGKYVEAIRKWERVVGYDPGHEKARFNIERAKKKLEGVMNVK